MSTERAMWPSLEAVPLNTQAPGAVVGRAKEKLRAYVPVPTEAYSSRNPAVPELAKVPVPVPTRRTTRVSFRAIGEDVLPEVGVSVFESVPVGVLVCDVDGVPVLVEEGVPV